MLCGLVVCVDDDESMRLVVWLLGVCVHHEGVFPNFSTRLFPIGHEHLVDRQRSLFLFSLSDVYEWCVVSLLILSPAKRYHPAPKGKLEATRDTQGMRRTPNVNYAKPGCDFDVDFESIDDGEGDGWTEPDGTPALCCGD